MTVLEHLKPSTLRALAAALEARLPPERLTACDLTDEGVERLGEILTQGDTPTIGFYRRYRKPEAIGDLQTSPRGRLIQAHAAVIQVATWIKVAADMEDEGWPADVVARAVARVASERGQHFEVAA